MEDVKAQRRVGVIMAGGSGERFWPLSRHLRPKQLLSLTDPAETMLSEALKRLRPLMDAQEIYVATGRHLADAIRRAETGILADNVIAEPCKRNTAGCLALAAITLVAKYAVDPDHLTVAVTTADHLIGQPERFRQVLETAMDAAEERNALVTIGIAPTRPETGYGYIRAAADTRSAGAVSVYPVEAFVEKPDQERAEQFLRDGAYYWNSGMFVWKLSTFLAELQRVRPQMFETVQAMSAAAQQGDEALLDRLFERLEDISIDYALMEQATNVLVVRGDFPWDDVGAWPALDRTREQDSAGNVTQGHPVLVDCRDCIVYNEPGAKAMAVGVVGMRDVVVVVAQDAILVMPKDRAQDVREVVKELKNRQAPQV